MDMFKYILILLSCSVIFVVICRRLHLPAIIGYLTVGMIVGPGGVAWLPTIEDLNHLAEFGIVFLMFTLGLEFSIPRLMAAKRILLGVGGLQVIICATVAACGAWLLGSNLPQSVIIGGALALSSTAVVVKQLAEQKQQHTPYGSMAINILLFQDLAAVGFLILIPALSGNSNSLPITFLLTIIKGIFAFVTMTLISMWVLRPLFHEVARARSTELFMLATLLVALSAAGVTHYLDLSMALGAFLAGLMLGETEFRHQIELDIRPFRDVLLGLFFVVIGANLNLSLLPHILDKVLLLLVAILIGKMILIAGIVKTFSRLSIQAALRTGLILAHGGEFTFVLLTEAIDKNILTDDNRAVLFSAVALSILIAPILIRYNEKIIELFRRNCKKDDLELKDFNANQLTDIAAELEHHVILCGYGRVGQILARFLDQEEIPWIALDMDPIRLSKSSMAGEHAFYGDATQPNTLLAAGLSRARMVVITFAEEEYALQTVKNVREMRLDLPVFVRTQDDSNLKAFQDAGATEVVPEILESSLMLASHLLLTLGTPTKKIIDKIRTIHADRYEILRGMYRGEDDKSDIEDEIESRRSLHTIFVPEGANAINQPLSAITPNDEEFYIKSLTRNGERLADPAPTMIIELSDVLVIFATPEETTAIEEKILNGIFNNEHHEEPELT